MTMLQLNQTPAESIDELSTKVAELVGAIQDFVTNLPTGSDPVIDKLKADLNAYNTSAFQNFLGTLPKDLDGVEAALRLVKAYLQATTFMDKIDVDALGVKSGALKKVKESYHKLQQARQALRDALTDIRDDDVDLLGQLLIDSAALLKNPPVNVAALVDHLRNARKIVRQLKQDNIDLDDDLVGQLIENWQAAIEKLPDPNGAVTEDGRRSAVAQTLDIHNLLEAIYDLLAQDVSVENPFDLVSL
jgi:hypothetical protein